MTTILKLIIDNKEWLFSGLGIVVLTALIRFVPIKKSESDTSTHSCNYLTLLPVCVFSQARGRKRELNRIKHLLKKSLRKINITGVVGVGKSFFCALLADTLSNQFTQIGWISYQNDLYSSVASALIEIDKEKISTDGIKNAIQQILLSFDQETLIFIDGLNDNMSDSELNVLLSCKCTVVINSTLPNVGGFYNYELKQLCTRDAIKLFCAKVPYFTKQKSVVKAIVTRHTYGIPLLIVALSNVGADYYRTNLNNLLSLLDSRGLLELSWADIACSYNSKARKKIKEILMISYRILELNNAEIDLLKKLEVINTGYYLHGFLLKLCLDRPSVIASLSNKRWINYLDKENCYYVSPIIFQVISITLEPKIDTYLKLYNLLRYRRSIGSVGRYENCAIYSELLAVNSVKHQFNGSEKFNDFLVSYLEYLSEGPDKVLALKWNSFLFPNTVNLKFEKAFLYEKIYMGMNNERSELYGIKALKFAEQMNNPVYIRDSKAQLMLLYGHNLKNFQKAQKLISEIMTLDYIGDYVCCLETQISIALYHKEYEGIKNLLSKNQSYFPLFEQKEPLYTSWLFDVISDYFYEVNEIQQGDYYRKKSVQLAAVYYGYGEYFISKINRTLLKNNSLVSLVNDDNQYGFVYALPKFPKKGIKTDLEENIDALDLDSLFYYAIQEKLSNNTAKAVELLELSIKKGNLNAYCELGLMYALGDFPQLNFKAAYNLWNVGSQMGSSFCKCNLAIMYKSGFYVKKDIDRALSLLRSAAKLGCYKANRHIGDILYERGQIENAKEKYMLASEYGCRTSSFAIAQIYQRDCKDIQNALIFYELAQEQGYPDLDSIIDEIKTSLPI